MGQDLQDTYKHLAPDYSGSPYTEALENGQDRYLVFEGRLTEVEGKIDIPRGERFGGQHHDALPCTLNGFIACRSDEILSEFKIPYGSERYPEDGSVIWVIENGEKRKAAVFDDNEMKFVPYEDANK